MGGLIGGCRGFLLCLTFCSVSIRVCRLGCAAFFNASVFELYEFIIIDINSCEGGQECRKKSNGAKNH